jgi:capsular polysaccharide transport system permease protein
MSLDAISPSFAGRVAQSPPVAWAVMRAVVFALFLRELKTRLGGRWWGLLWALGEPLAAAAVLLGLYMLAHAQAVGGVDPLLFLVSGVLPFQLFKNLVLRSMEAIDANQGLFAYRQVRPIDAVLARALVELTLALGVLAVTLLVLAWLGHDVLPRHPLELFGVSALLVALGSALGLLAAVATGGAMACGRAAIRVATLPLMLASGVVFPVAALPPAVRELLLLNPLLHLLEGLRGAVFGSAYHALPQASSALPLATLLVTAALALALYRARRDRLQAS